ARRRAVRAQPAGGRAGSGMAGRGARGARRECRMKRVRIDFAPASLARTLCRTHPAAWALCLIALLLTLAALGAGWQLLARQRADQITLAAARARASAAPPAPAAQAPV